MSETLAAKPLQFRLIVLGVVIGIIGPLAFNALRTEYLEPRAYFNYRGTEGPFRGIYVDNELTAGPPVTALEPGETIAWRTTICFDKDVSVRADVIIRPYPEGQPINTQEVFLRPRDLHCEPKVVGRQIPLDTLPGSYFVERLLLIQPEKGVPVPAKLPSINFRVVAK